MLNDSVAILKLKKSNCKNCHKCIRNCPVGSIRFSDHQAHIVDKECILCGQCFVVCPQNAKKIRSDLSLAKELISSGVRVIASIAPSFAAIFPNTDIYAIEKVLRKLGFFSVEETAMGATIVKREYEKIISSKRQEIVISSCCHTVNLLIQKHYPEALSYLANVITPMQAHCLDIKKRCPDAKTVFIGPCISKKDEAEQTSKATDCVLTFEELDQWLEEENIKIANNKKTQQEPIMDKVSDKPAVLWPDKKKTGKTRFFPTSGGIIKSMNCYYEGFSYLAIDGMENCLSALQEIIAGNIKSCFIEMSACSGSCVGGPVMSRNFHRPVQNYSQIAAGAGNQDFPVEELPSDLLKANYNVQQLNNRMPDEIEITAILKQIGKTKPEHELNCGTCGYDTCRKKAIAVYQGKADLSMCLPFLKEKAESFSDNIINNTPNGIIVVDENYQVQQINKAACRIMNIRSPEDVLGDQVVRIMDPKPFMDVLQKRQNIHGRRTYLAEYKKYVEENIILDREFNLVICIMHDVTDEEKEREKKESIRHQTTEIADKVIEKQMRVVQEIASLLGETTAETKIALAKLKESISDE